MKVPDTVTELRPFLEDFKQNFMVDYVLSLEKISQLSSRCDLFTVRYRTSPELVRSLKHLKSFLTSFHQFCDKAMYDKPRKKEIALMQRAFDEVIRLF